MFCPRCHTAELVERSRDAIKIDVCGSCRGVWLDRGELEILMSRAIEREREQDAPPIALDDDDDRRQAARYSAATGRRPRDDDDDDHDPRRGRRRWWEIFD